jgi:uncharacterized circularly permuted ATP-grasp superfamily protein
VLPLRKGRAPGRPTPRPAADQDYFDEIFVDPRAPEVRPQYRRIQEIHRRLSPARRAQIRAAFARELGTPVDEFPRVLTEAEHRLLKAGIAQRARVLRAFLLDLYSGEPQFLAAGVMSWQELDRLSATNRDAIFLGRLRPGDLAVPYAPDIVRDRRGDFVVLEDNTGDVGGRGDFLAIHQLFFELAPELAAAIQPVGDPGDYHRAMMRRYEARARPLGSKIVYWASERPYSDREYLRLERLYEALGAEVVSAFTRGKKLVTTPAGVFLETTDGARTARERVGFVILGAHPMDVDFTHGPTREYWLEVKARKALKRASLDDARRGGLAAALVRGPDGSLDGARIRALLRGTPEGRELDRGLRKSPRGLTEAILDGRVATESTGGDIVSDKGFYRFVPALLELYFPGEAAILKSLRTEPLLDRAAPGLPRIRTELLCEVAARPERYVVKRVDGYGGSTVTVGAAVARRKFLAALALASAEPEAYVIQDYSRLSEVNGSLVDYRGYAEITAHDCYVGDFVWGRSAAKGRAEGKVNVKLGGGMSGIFRVRDAVLAPLRKGR